MKTGDLKAADDFSGLLLGYRAIGVRYTHAGHLSPAMRPCIRYQSTYGCFEILYFLVDPLKFAQLLLCDVIGDS